MFWTVGAVRVPHEYFFVAYSWPKVSLINCRGDRVYDRVAKPRSIFIAQAVPAATPHAGAQPEIFDVTGAVAWSFPRSSVVPNTGVPCRQQSGDGGCILRPTHRVVVIGRKAGYLRFPTAFVGAFPKPIVRSRETAARSPARSSLRAPGQDRARASPQPIVSQG
jgi:hypothetical protein